MKKWDEGYAWKVLWGTRTCNGEKEIDDYENYLPTNEPGECLPDFEKWDGFYHGYHLTLEPHKWEGNRVFLCKFWEGREVGNYIIARRIQFLKEVTIKNCIDPQIFIRIANLEGADLKGVDLSNANLERVNLVGADLRWANLERANLKGANLYKANLEYAKLRRAHLERSYLAEANLLYTDLFEANLGEANLWKTDLRASNLRAAILWGTNWEDAIVSDGIDLEHVNIDIKPEKEDEDYIEIKQTWSARVRRNFENEHSIFCW